MVMDSALHFLIRNVWIIIHWYYLFIIKNYFFKKKKIIR